MLDSNPFLFMRFSEKKLGSTYCCTWGIYLWYKKGDNSKWLQCHTKHQNTPKQLPNTQPHSKHKYRDRDKTTRSREILTWYRYSTSGIVGLNRLVSTQTSPLYSRPNSNTHTERHTIRYLHSIQSTISTSYYNNQQIK